MVGAGYHTLLTTLCQEESTPADGGLSRTEQFRQTGLEGDGHHVIVIFARETPGGDLNPGERISGGLLREQGEVAGAGSGVILADAEGKPTGQGGLRRAEIGRLLQDGTISPPDGRSAGEMVGDQFGPEGSRHRRPTSCRFHPGCKREVSRAARGVKNAAVVDSGWPCSTYWQPRHPYAIPRGRLLG